MPNTFFCKQKKIIRYKPLNKMCLNFITFNYRKLAAEYLASRKSVSRRGRLTSVLTWGIWSS